MKTVKLTIIALVIAFGFLFTGIQETNATQLVNVNFASKIVKKHGHKYIWVQGHWKRNAFGKLVWVPGHWKKV